MPSRAWCEIAYKLAATRGHPDVMKYLHAMKPVCARAVSAAPADGGRLDVIEILHAHGALSSATMCHAADNGKWDIVRFMLGNGYTPDKWVIIAAILRCNVPMIRTLRWWRCPWDATVYSFAAIIGDQKVCQYLRKNGCPSDETTAFVAAAHGHTNLLRKLLGSGCPWFPKSTTNVARRGGHTHTVEFIEKVLKIY